MKLFDINDKKTKKQELPLLPLRELVIFPYMVTPFFVGRKKSIQAVEEAMEQGRNIFLASQKSKKENPLQEDIYTQGTVAHILQLLRLPDGTLRVLVEGKERGAIQRFIGNAHPFRVSVKTMEESKDTDPGSAALMRTIQKGFRRFTQLHKKIPPEVISSVEKAEYPNKLVNLVAAHLPLKMEKKMELLEETDTRTRLENLAVTLESENEVLSIQERISSKVKKRLEKNQKEYFLNEQIKEINKELGREDDDPSGTKELKQKLDKKDLPDEVREKAERELKRLSKLQAMSPEAGILRSYLEWVIDLPWRERTEENKDICQAEKTLDKDHYDMKKPKERVLDFIAVRQLKEKLKGPILCFVGPPGTGKTSLGRSVARSLGREFVRMSLGGLRDEAEIRGHRKTYVGALPGKIIQSMKKAGSTNPVVLLDEIDKLSSDFRGDPAAALLEVLDPEQNKAFMDHYLELTYDLSDVMFITTANSLHKIPHPLRDRMEVIEIPGYTEFEKTKIAQEFIIPKQLEENGLSWAQILFRKDAILEIVRNYTMESGVRNLERQIANVIRKLARDAVKNDWTQKREKGETLKKVVTKKGVRRYLGNPKFDSNPVQKEQRPGLTYGLAWTEMGGTILPVEAAVLEGSGKLTLTGSLGDVMKESAHAAVSFIRSHQDEFKVPEGFHSQKDVHIHVPEGAIPKDGPSAGITITTSILSALSATPVKKGISMTGEITLTGRVLPIGGVKEKVLAAHRYGMDQVILPEGNKKDLEDIPQEVKGKITFHFCSTIMDAVQVLFPEDLFS
ncbi:MAG: endopeptidase La [Spirochaetia bacterium]